MCKYIYIFINIYTDINININIYIHGFCNNLSIYKYKYITQTNKSISMAFVTTKQTTRHFKKIHAFH